MREGTVWQGGNGAQLVLRPDRSAFMESEQALLVADVHLGKAGHFRRHGMAVPNGVNAATLARLKAAVESTSARRLVVLGDLFHSDRNAEWDGFIQWRHRLALDHVVLVQGNHDILSPRDWADAELDVVPRWDAGGLTCTHEPGDWKDGFGVHACGHLHPGVRLHGAGRQSLTAACWWHAAPGSEREQLVFPAFGGFTGNHRIAPHKGDALYIPAGDRVIKKEP